MRLVPAQSLLNGGRIDRTAPVAFEDFHFDPKHGGHLAPAGGEATAFERQHELASAQDVGERRLPAAVTIRGVNVGVTLRAEYAGKIRKTAVGNADHFAGVDVDGRPVHGGQHIVGNVGRPRNTEELSAFADAHAWACPFYVLHAGSS